MIVARVSRIDLKDRARSKITLHQYDKITSFIQKRNLDQNFMVVIAKDEDDAVNQLRQVIFEYPQLKEVHEYLHFTIQHGTVDNNRFWLNLSCMTSRWFDV